MAWYNDLIDGAGDVFDKTLTNLKSWNDYEFSKDLANWRLDNINLTNPFEGSVNSDYAQPNPPANNTVNSGLSSQQIITYGLMAAGALILLKVIK